ncbi:hypothetical protein LSH36_1171g00027 [Paralvinella palmiformis]|uniref:Dehydrogenase/reductase SDR family member 11 n=1 Tax=Paralvinella palmiformis TaxID=53620 RepID=A0AAD9IVZ3_9ANNE|nr:hypothetical protein LSH36_1171g00027 [Paralvinella palmiformis]
MERWVGRIALVTGASSGIGSAITVGLVRHKIKVIGCGRDMSRLQELSNQLSAENGEGCFEPMQCDLRKESDIKNMFNMIQTKYGGLDVCINNAGLIQVAPLLSGSTEAWREMLDVNILALTIVTREAYHMSGHRLLSSADTSFYQATKFAVKALTEGVRKELRYSKSGIRIAEISPGVVRTEIFSRAEGDEYDDKVFKNVKEPLQPKDIADAVLYIMSAPPQVEINDVLIRPTQQQL